MHNGIDLAAPAGTPIQAVMDGVVIANSYQAGGAGNYIKIRHADGTTSTYMHMRSRSPLKVGQRVSTGQVIGGVGTTGSSTGNHLHLEIRDKNGKPFNPLLFLQNASKRGGGVYRQQSAPIGGFRVQGKALGQAPRIYQEYISLAGQKYGVRTPLIAAIMKAESNFNPKARSGVGAVGLMQLMPKYHGHKGNIYDPKQNVMIGTQYLVSLLKKFGDVRMAIAAYNAGDGRVSKLIKRYGNSWEKIAPHLPSETKKYVPKVLSYL